jgi:hypothetical protein
MNLLPNPRQLNFISGSYELTNHQIIRIPDSDAVFIANRFQAALRKSYGFSWELNQSWAVPQAQVGMILSYASDEMIHPQGYILEIHPQRGIVLKAHDRAGLYYGVCTLIQVLQQSPDHKLPCLTIADWPDFLARGVMLDISRDKVPTLETLMALIDRLSTWKINQVQLYTEHTFAYRKHPIVWEKASPLTAEEILFLDQYCRNRCIELVPNQNSFGHMARWLKFPVYADLAEVSGDFPVPWGIEHGPFSLSPVEPGSLELIRELFDELLPNFTSKTINVGCDETFDLGKGKSKQMCDTIGEGRVYLDFLLKIYRDLSRRGYKMMFWGDIIVQHPELVPELPSDMIALPWGYEANHPFDAECAQFAEAGLEFYVCPGTSSWNCIGGRTTNALGNLLNAAENGLKHGASGYLITDWGDCGHWQVLPVSYLGFMAGAAFSWCYSANCQLGQENTATLQEALSLFAYEDLTGSMGRMAYELGDVYRVPGINIPNASLLFWSLRWPIEQLQGFPQKLAQILNGEVPGFGILVDDGKATDADVSIPRLFQRVFQTREAIQKALQPLASEKMECSDAGLIRREFLSSARLMLHACDRIEFALGDGKTPQELSCDMEEILKEYKSIWLERNRPGGLEDSCARFEEIIAEY